MHVRPHLDAFRTGHLLVPHRVYYPFAFQKFGLTEIRQVIESEAYPYAVLQLNGRNVLKDL